MIQSHIRNLSFGQSPFPVVAQSCRYIHTCFVSKAEVILDRNDRQVSHTCKSCTDQCPYTVIYRYFIAVDVFSYKVSVMTLKVFQPSFGRLVVMGSCIDNAVMFIFIWKIRAVLTSVKSKLQDFHSRIAAFFEHFQNALCQESKILCDHAKVLDLLFRVLKRSIPGPFSHLPFCAVVSPYGIA